MGREPKPTFFSPARRTYRSYTWPTDRRKHAQHCSFQGCGNETKTDVTLLRMAGIKKTKKQLMLARQWRKRKSYTLLVVMQTGAGIEEPNGDSSKKIIIEITLIQQLHYGEWPRINANIDLKRHTKHDAYCNIITTAKM